MAALFLIFLVALWLTSGAYCGEVAAQKGYSRSAWVELSYRNVFETHY